MKYFIVILFLLWLYSCREKDFIIYDSENYIQFISALKDSTTVSFTFYPRKDELLWPLPVEMSGAPIKEDLKYNVVIDKERTTAIEGKHFELLPEMSIQANNVVDTCWLKLNRTPDMKNHEFRIVLRLSDTKQLLRGQINYTIAVIRVNDKITRPDWWDGDITQYYLGKYSDKKFSLFIEVTGKADLTESSDSEKRVYSLQLKYWLQAQKEQGNTIWEDDGTEMTVPVMG